ncbi:MAG: glycosyltransferase family 4 protein, partial [Gammaproteobacteria bacterium]|nr:glycosyltransferase family 4 protein [Gammaproteobacteria bacterium]
LVIDDIAPIWEEEQQYGVGLKKSARGIYRQVTDQAKLLIAVNETIKRHLQKEGLPEEKIAVVENGIDGHLFYPGVDGRELRTRHGILGDEVVIVFVGSFQPYHRVDLLLHAFARVDTSKPIRLLLVGEGKYTPEARLVADNLDVLDRTIFTGRVPYDRVAAYAAAGDICIMPATNEYGNPMKVYEYMALGKAVLAPDQQTITDIATHNLNAYLFERENVEAISKAMQRLVDDTALRYRLGRQAGKLAAEHTWQKRAERMIWSIEQAGICA